VVCAGESQLGSSEVFTVVVNMKRNSCVCGPRELFVNNRVEYIVLNIVSDDDDDDDDNTNTTNNNNDNNTSLLTFVILDKNLTRLGFVCMTATFHVVDMVAHLVILCSRLLCLR
jgi:hypothetical protein